METNQKSAKAKISPEFFRKVLLAELEAVCNEVFTEWNTGVDGAKYILIVLIYKT